MQAGSGGADDATVALMGKDVAAGEAAIRRIVEGEVIDVLGQRQLSDGDPVFDRARLLLGDLRTS
jgi:hypothetical protein